MAFNILVVDDSSTIRAVIRKALEIAGVPVNEVREAANGKEALDLLDEHWVDLVFADIHMPVMGGIEMLDTMRNSGLLESIPVIIISNEGSTTRIAELRAKGVRAFIRKPFTPERIREVVDEVIGAPNGTEAEESPH